MADDIITFGGPERGRQRGKERGSGDTLESLFQAHYAHLVLAAHATTGDWPSAERLAKEAYLSLWRRWSVRRWMTEPVPDSLPYLERAVAALAAAWVQRRGLAQIPGADPGAQADPGAEVDPGAEAAEHGIDVVRAWQDFAELRSRSRTTSQRRLAAACLSTALMAAAIAAAITAATPAAAPGPGQPRARNSVPALFPGAVAARIPLSGVVSVTGDGTHAWAVRRIGLSSFDVTSYQLVGIDLQTNQVTLRVSLGRQLPAVAAGGGRVWLTTARGRARGQLARLDPETGHVVARYHLPAGRCTSLTYGDGQLFASCWITRPVASEFFRIDPAAGGVEWHSKPISAETGAMAVTRHALWYVIGYDQVRGLAVTGARTRAMTAPAPGYELSNTGDLSLAYGEGSVWELTAGESVLRIDPASGRVLRVLRASGYDPAHAGGLDFLTFGAGSLWFLDDGYPFSGVLRVAAATGRPLGGVTVEAGSCGLRSCSQIYATPGAIWVPTLLYLLRIDPARMTPGLHPQPGHGDAADRPVTMVIPGH